jgi:hypothetical protein
LANLLTVEIPLLIALLAIVLNDDETDAFIAANPPAAAVEARKP